MKTALLIAITVLLVSCTQAPKSLEMVPEQKPEIPTGILSPWLQEDVAPDILGFMFAALGSDNAGACLDFEAWKNKTDHESFLKWCRDGMNDESLYDLFLEYEENNKTPDAAQQEETEKSITESKTYEKDVDINEKLIYHSELQMQVEVLQVSQKKEEVLLAVAKVFRHNPELRDHDMVYRIVVEKLNTVGLTAVARHIADKV